MVFLFVFFLLVGKSYVFNWFIFYFSGCSERESGVLRGGGRWRARGGGVIGLSKDARGGVELLSLWAL